jgi:hypothetical protein
MLLEERASQCLPLKQMPRLALDQEPGSRACLLEAKLLVHQWLVMEEWECERLFTAGDCGGAAILIPAGGNVQEERESRR